MEFVLAPYIVYVKTDSDGYITAVNCSEFLDDASGWTEIDRGYGARYHHAQGNYFPLSIQTDGGAYRYKLKDGILGTCSDEEIAEQENMHQCHSVNTQEARIAKLEEQNEMLVQCILEMSEILYA